WDDHEVQNDYAGTQAGASGARDPAAPEDFAARRAAAYQAYYEHMPLRASALARALGGAAGQPALRMHERLQVGRLLSMHLLDDRQYRDAQVCTRDGQRGASPVNPAKCPAWLDPKRSLLGAQQEAWLEQSLARRDTAQSSWNVIAQQTVFGKRDFRPGPDEIFSNDGWDGYSAARARLTAALRKHQLPHTVVLGGDVHANWVGHIKADYADPRSAAIGVEFCGTSVTSHGGSNEPMAQRLAENPHFVFADAEARGYGVAEFSPGQLLTTLRAVQDVSRRDSGINTLARFAVRSGTPVLERLA
ncbi:MAG: alkaline phosphatase D family protein, partial [Burkholderiaceae bacterium]